MNTAPDEKPRGRCQVLGLSAQGAWPKPGDETKKSHRGVCVEGRCPAGRGTEVRGEKEGVGSGPGRAESLTQSLPETRAGLIAIGGNSGKNLLWLLLLLPVSRCVSWEHGETAGVLMSTISRFCHPLTLVKVPWCPAPHI